MSERTTIGGITYESIGSSDANLLLKCNGTARILWGNKFIDLINHGKIASKSENLIFAVSDASKIKLDGVYILMTKELIQLWICKNKQKYNITELFVLTLTPRLENIEKFLGLDKTNENTESTDTINSDLFIMKGTIILYSGVIPEGWGLCNGETYTYKNSITVSPNLPAPNEQTNYIIKL